MAEYLTKDGDMLDWICWMHYGQRAQLNEATRQIEPHILAAQGDIGDEVEMLSQFSTTDLRGIVEQVLDANPGIASLGTVLPSGVALSLPEISAKTEDVATVQLWDD
jgi:P2-like prophage tail protein X